MNLNSKIYVAGHNGMVGSAIVRRLRSLGYTNILEKDRSELDLCDAVKVKDFFKNEQPEYVFLAAAKVGGILANRDYPADFIYQNLQIQNNVIHSSYRYKVKKLLFLGSTCIYPKLTSQPMNEESLLTGLLEPSNEPYAIAKIAGIKMCQSYNRQYGTNFIACMPTNLYGPNDNFDLKTSHVLPAMIAKFHNAKVSGDKNVELWGDGSPRREFMHVDDMADASIHLMKEFSPSKEENTLGKIFVNIGVGEDISIKELAEIVREIVGFEGEITRDTKKPNGTPRKLVDINKLNQLKRAANIPLWSGIRSTYETYLVNHGD